MSVVVHNSSSNLLDGLGDEVMLLMGVLLAGLTLVVAWMSTHVPQDVRPITVFVFQNFGRHRRQYSNASVASVTSTNNSSTVLVATHGVGLSTSSTVDSGTYAATPMADISRANMMTATVYNDNYMSPSQAIPTTVHNANSDVPFSSEPINAASFMDNDPLLIEDEDDLIDEDEALSQQMEEVLQEYSEVMEMHSSESQLRQRRLRYFNCLFGDTPTLADGTSDEMHDAVQTCRESCSAAAVSSDAPDEDQQLISATESQSLHQMATSPQALFSLTDPPPEGFIQLRIKYLDDRQKTVFADPDEDIASFRRKHFNSELAANMSVRLIFNGHELKEGTGLTLKSYAVPNNATIHCLVSENSVSDTASNDASNSSAHLTGTRSLEDVSSGVGSESDMGGLMFPLFAAILGLIWYCRFSYRHYFNVMSTFALVGVTLLFFAACIASWTSRQTVRSHSPRGQPPIMVHRITLDS